MRQFLILTDLSEGSVNTYRYGLNLALAGKASIVLLYCSGDESLTMTGQFNYLQKLRSYADRYAHAVEETVGHLPPVECFVTAGEPVSAISKMAETRPVDLLICDESFLSNLKSEKPSPLQLLVPCPAVIVPKGAVYKKIKEIVFATDFTDQNTDVASGICNLAAEIKAQVTFIHFYPKKDRNRLVLLKHEAEALKKALAPAKTSFRLIEEEDLLEGLNDYAENNRADMFVLATQDTHLLQQYFEKTYFKTQAYHTRVPLLNLYQKRRVPCSAGCSYCNTEHSHYLKEPVTF